MKLRRNNRETWTGWVRTIHFSRDSLITLCLCRVLSLYRNTFVFDISKIRQPETAKMLKGFLRTYVCRVYQRLGMAGNPKTPSEETLRNAGWLATWVQCWLVKGEMNNINIPLIYSMHLHLSVCGQVRPMKVIVTHWTKVNMAHQTSPYHLTILPQRRPHVLPISSFELIH